MKKLITIALLTLSTCSLMAQFPVRRDNFNQFCKESEDWSYWVGDCIKCKGSKHIDAHELKVNDVKTTKGFDSENQVHVIIREFNGISCQVTNVKDGTIYFSTKCDIEKDHAHRFIFTFKETEAKLMLVSCNEWFYLWKLWQ